MALQIQGKQLFILTANPGDNTLLPISSSAQGIEQNFQVGEDADFVMGSTMANVDSDALGTIAAAQEQEVKWTDSGRTILMNDFSRLSALYGTAQRPFILPIEHQIFRNRTFTVTVNNLVASNRYIYLAHAGYKMFQDGR